MKRIKTLLFLVVMFLTMGVVKAETFEVVSDKNLSVYSVKEKEEVLIENVDILSFYKNNPRAIIEEEIIEEVEEETEEVIVEEPVYYYVNVPFDGEVHNEIVSFAMQFNGYPYVMGGNSLTGGTDCSGFVQLVYANFGISLPRTTYEQSISGYGISLDAIEPGDIISYGYNGYATHSALYVGNGTIIHASTPALGIRYDSMYIMPIVAVRRVV